MERLGDTLEVAHIIRGSKTRKGSDTRCWLETVAFAAVASCSAVSKRPLWAAWISVWRAFQPKLHQTHFQRFRSLSQHSSLQASRFRLLQIQKGATYSHMVSSTCWKLYIDARHHFAEFSPWLFTGSPLNPLHSACPARCCLAICIRPSNSSNRRFSFCIQIYLSSQVVSQTKTR